MKSKSKKLAWFRKVRGSYLPLSWQGLAIYFVYVSYVIALPVIWYQDGHRLRELLFSIIPLMVAAALLTQYVASKSTK